MFQEMMPMSSGGGAQVSRVNMFNFTEAQMINATDANPLVLEGDFSKATCMSTHGEYSTNAGYQWGGYNISNISPSETPSWTNWYVATHGSNASNLAYRHIKLYPNKIEIGTGNLNNSTFQSTYGAILILIVGIPED